MSKRFTPASPSRGRLAPPITTSTQEARRRLAALAAALTIRFELTAECARPII